jgi:hypothetical protein
MNEQLQIIKDYYKNILKILRGNELLQIDGYEELPF